MEINKILFEQIKRIGIDADFETLDVNNDGKINSSDAEITQDGKISGEIINLLNAADLPENIEIIEEDAPFSETDQKASASTTSTTKSSNTVLNLNAASFNDEVSNSKGTTFLVVNDAGSLSVCDNSKGMQWANKMAEKYGDKANVVYGNLSCPSYIKDHVKGSIPAIYSEVSSGTKSDIQSMISQLNYNGGYPCVIRLVDGVPQEVTSIKRVDDKSIDAAGAKIEGTKSVSEERSKEEFAKSVQRGMGATTYMSTEKEASQTTGTTFAIFNCVTVSTSSCGDAAAKCESLKNNMVGVYDVMYDLKDMANFIYQPTMTYYGPLSEDGKIRHTQNAPCIVVYENGVQKEVIWLDDISMTSPEAIRDIFTSKLGSTQTDKQGNRTGEDVSISDDTKSGTGKSELNPSIFKKNSLEVQYKNEEKKLEEMQKAYQKIIAQIDDTKDGEDISGKKAAAKDLEVEISTTFSNLSSLKSQIQILKNMH